MAFWSEENIKLEMKHINHEIFPKEKELALIKYFVLLYEVLRLPSTEQLTIVTGKLHYNIGNTFRFLGNLQSAMESYVKALRVVNDYIVGDNSGECEYDIKCLQAFILGNIAEYYNDFESIDTSDLMSILKDYDIEFTKEALIAEDIRILNDLKTKIKDGEKQAVLEIHIIIAEEILK